MILLDEPDITLSNTASLALKPEPHTEKLSPLVRLFWMTFSLACGETAFVPAGPFSPGGP
jgi:hypothetical protein